MPVKRRKDKRRAALPPDAWETLFECGHDYFDALAPLGLPDPLRLPPDGDARTAATAAWDAALRDAWGQYGRAFMAAWEPQPGRATPWALDIYGPPEAMKGNTPCQ
jgi:hypothetical protein